MHQNRHRSVIVLDPLAVQRLLEIAIDSDSVASVDSDDSVA